MVLAYHSLNWGIPTFSAVCKNNSLIDTALTGESLQVYQFAQWVNSYLQSITVGLLVFIGTNDEKLFDGNTPGKLYKGNHTLHSKKFSQHIFPANVYKYILKLVAPSVEQQTIDDNYIIKDMESEEVTVQCYSKPSKIFGMYKVHTVCLWIWKNP